MSEPARHWQVAIIGAGPGGLGLAIRLAQSGRRDFVILEASDGVGGTWRVNTYPGAACDVPSHLYSYSFALKPDWSKTYANQPEILEYFEQCADRFGMRPHLRTGTRITSAHWDEGAQYWRLLDDRGNTYEADVVVSAIGTFTIATANMSSALRGIGSRQRRHHFREKRGCHESPCHPRLCTLACRPCGRARRKPCT